jgi:hypothetical protein
MGFYFRVRLLLPFLFYKIISNILTKSSSALLFDESMSVGSVWSNASSCLLLSPESLRVNAGHAWA